MCSVAGAHVCLRPDQLPGVGHHACVRIEHRQTAQVSLALHRLRVRQQLGGLGQVDGADPSSCAGGGTVRRRRRRRGQLRAELRGQLEPAQRLPEQVDRLVQVPQLPGARPNLRRRVLMNSVSSTQSMASIAEG